MLEFIIMMLNRFIDFVLDRVQVFSDYYLVKKHVTLSESAIFMFSLTRAIWFGIFGIQNVSYDMLWGDTVWFGIYFVITILHFITFFIDNLKPRVAVLFFNAFLWLFLATLALFSGSRAPIVPGLVILSMLSIVIGTRLLVDKEEDESSIKV